MYFMSVYICHFAKLAILCMWKLNTTLIYIQQYIDWCKLNRIAFKCNRKPTHFDNHSVHSSAFRTSTKTTTTTKTTTMTTMTAITTTPMMTRNEKNAVKYCQLESRSILTRSNNIEWFSKLSYSSLPHFPILRSLCGRVAHSTTKKRTNLLVNFRWRKRDEFEQTEQLYQSFIYQIRRQNLVQSLDGRTLRVKRCHLVRLECKISDGQCNLLAGNFLCHLFWYSGDSRSPKLNRSRILWQGLYGRNGKEIITHTYQMRETRPINLAGWLAILAQLKNMAHIQFLKSIVDGTSLAKSGWSVVSYTASGVAKLNEQLK